MGFECLFFPPMKEKKGLIIIYPEAFQCPSSQLKLIKKILGWGKDLVIVTTSPYITFFIEMCHYAHNLSISFPAKKEKIQKIISTPIADLKVFYWENGRIVKAPQDKMGLLLNDPFKKIKARLEYDFDSLLEIEEG
jgi:hypothetical protein